LKSISSKDNKFQETKREKFVRIAERRVIKILENLNSLGKCSNRNNYKYSREDVRKIFDAIEKRVKTIRTLYENSNEIENSFKLSDCQN